MDGRTPGKRAAPRRLRSYVSLIGLAALAYVVIGGPLDYLGDLISHPWALANPSIMDGWRGELTTGNRERLTVSLHLERARAAGERRSCARCPQLAGAATTCDARGQVRTYRLSGSPHDRKASTLTVGAVPAVDPPPDGLELSVLEGRWEDPNTLQLLADFHWRRGQSAISSTDDPATQPVPLRMTRVPDATSRPCGF